MEDNKLALELLHEVKKTSNLNYTILVYPKMRLMNLKIL